ncbi:MAG TPA: hypothetical protein PKO03_10740 [Anaerolineaceae bacterium]|nr:hypothetical protein [Anaerolineaceae bacterium]
MKSTADRRTRTRSTLVLIILATLPCYCLGFIVFQVGQALQKTPLPPTATLMAPTETLLGPTAVLTLTSTPLNFPTFTVSPTPTITWTASITYTPFLPPTRTMTTTPTLTQSPTHTATSLPSSTPTPTKSPTRIGRFNSSGI